MLGQMASFNVLTAESYTWLSDGVGIFRIYRSGSLVGSLWRWRSCRAHREIKNSKSRRLYNHPYMSEGETLARSRPVFSRACRLSIRSCPCWIWDSRPHASRGTSIRQTVECIIADCSARPPALERQELMHKVIDLLPCCSCMTPLFAR